MSGNLSIRVIENVCCTFVIVVNQHFGVVKFFGILIFCQLGVDKVLGGKLGIGNPDVINMQFQISRVITAFGFVCLHGIESCHATQFFHMANVTYSFSVGQPGTHIADGTVPVSGKGTGFLFHPVNHNTGPVPGDFVVTSTGGTMATIVDQIQNTGLGL